MANEKGNPNHASNGQFASGGGSGGSASNPPATPTPGSKSEKQIEGLKRAGIAVRNKMRESGNLEGSAEKYSKEKSSAPSNRLDELDKQIKSGTESGQLAENARKNRSGEMSNRMTEAAREKDYAKVIGGTKEEKAGTWKPTDVEKSSSPSKSAENTPRAIKERKEAAKRGQLHFEGGVAKEEKSGTWKPTDVEKSGKDELPEWEGRNLDKNPVGDKYPSAPSADCGGAAVWPGRTLD